MPAINSDVPIGYLMKGEEMLSFMRQVHQDGWRIFSRRPGVVPKAECPSTNVRVPRLKSGGPQGSGDPRPSVSLQHSRSRSLRERKPSPPYSTFVLSVGRLKRASQNRRVGERQSGFLTVPVNT